MQDVFEKIIKKFGLRAKKTEKKEMDAKYFEDAQVYKGERIAFLDAIEIVKQEAEQCKSIYMDGEYCWQSCWCTDRCGECNRLCNGDIDYYESYDARNNGWIPCSERLPEVEINPVTNDYVRYNVTYKNGDVSDVRYYAYGEASGGKHWLNGGRIMDEYVIAWQPLPQPYQPKRE